MNMWTQEAIQAENDYRRQQLHRLASPRKPIGERRTWYRWLTRSHRN